MNDASPIAAEATPIKKGRKFDQVLEGARQVFMADGYEGSSVDAIAKAAGVSKATLYSYFPDKKLLFMEVAKTECQSQIDASISGLDEGYEPPAGKLRRVGQQIMGLILSEFGQSMFRMCVAESDRFPELGREFFETGPAMGHARLVAYIERAVEEGDLRAGDADLAAHQFIELCHAKLFTEMVFGIRKVAEQAEMDRVIDGAVETFMARYGAGTAA
ncbi:TetR/AcrR family transcriptional regulator [Jannaschia sp. Os4]|uniref:TetR/AcrR family transcriptional regulator n=1 Tax=Jannaschia sp. Os4 TaxID=2807617 RepID=UPI00193ABBD6|nr:TetR/AcrR family transcriptional regulator [Jannaschia sp. Os4]MBM2575319.1 TetR/AcrR family transcriptional regulator [Jannaschia sp. Os4]